MMGIKDLEGRVLTDQALAVPVEPASGLAPAGFDPSRKVWLIWATEGEYSERREWPVAVAFDEVTAQQRTDRLGQLWRHLCATYREREQELEAEGDWIGKTLYADTPEGREFLLIGGDEDYFGGYAEDRMYTCSEVPVVASGIAAATAGETIGLDRRQEPDPQGDAQTPTSSS